MSQRNPITETERYYNKNFQAWTDRKTHTFHYEQEFAKMTKLWPERGSVLDIGCAWGIHVPLFLGIGRKLKYTGIDISTGFLKIAARRYPQLTFTKANIADGRTLPKKKFDGFWAAAVLMHVPFDQWYGMFTHITKMTKAGSYGFISLPIAHPSGTHKTESDTRHFTILSEVEHRAFFAKIGWKVKSSGSKDGFTSENVWRWYIVQTPTDT